MWKYFLFQKLPYYTLVIFRRFRMSLCEMYSYLIFLHAVCSFSSDGWFQANNWEVSLRLFKLSLFCILCSRTLSAIKRWGDEMMQGVLCSLFALHNLSFYSNFAQSLKECQIMAIRIETNTFFSLAVICLFLEPWNITDLYRGWLKWVGLSGFEMYWNSVNGSRQAVVDLV